MVEIPVDPHPKEDEVPILLTNLQAYIRRATTYETEQTLQLLSEKHYLMEFLCTGLISFRVYDDLGTEFRINAIYSDFSEKPFFFQDITVLIQTLINSGILHSFFPL